MSTNATQSYRITPRDFVREVLGHRWLVLFLATVFSGIAVIGVFLLPNQYKATTTILVDPQKVPERYVETTVIADPNERLNTITQQVLSATRLQSIVDEMNLYPAMRRKATPEEVLDFMRKKTSIQVKQGSGQGLSAFTITFISDDPKTAAAVANRLAQSFITWNVVSREQQALGTTEFLESQKQQALSNLQNQERSLRDFKLQHVGEMPEQLPTNLQALSRLQVQLQANIDAQNRLDSERLLLARTPQAEPLPSANTAGLSERARLEREKKQLDAELWDLRRRYTDSHPDVKAAEVRVRHVEQLIAALPADKADEPYTAPSATAVRLDVIARELARLKNEQDSIQRQIATYQGRVDAVPLREQQLTELTRNYDTSKEHYSSLMEKTFSAEMAEDLEKKQKGEHFTVLDPAKVPEKPFKPNRLMMLAGGVAFSFGISILCSGVRIFLTGAVRSSEELHSLLPASVTVLGSVPYIENRSDRRLAALKIAMLASSCAAICAAIVVVYLRTRPTF